MSNIIPSGRRQSQGGLTRRMTYPWDELRQQMSALFESFLGDWGALEETQFGPMRVWDFQVREEEKEIVVRAEMPGFDANDLDIRLDENLLTIQAEKRQKGDGHEEFRNFRRTVALPPGIDASKIEATYQNGVLDLHIPRSEEAQVRRIPIRGGQSSQQPQSEKEKSNPKAGAGK